MEQLKAISSSIKQLNSAQHIATYLPYLIFFPSSRTPLLLVISPWPRRCCSPLHHVVNCHFFCFKLNVDILQKLLKIYKSCLRGWRHHCRCQGCWRTDIHTPLGWVALLRCRAACSQSPSARFSSTRRGHPGRIRAQSCPLRATTATRSWAHAPIMWRLCGFASLAAAAARTRSKIT